MQGLASASRKAIVSAFLLGAGTLALAQGAAAQEQGAPADEASEGGLSEIIVTAQRRSEDLQRVPISVTALSADQLAATGLNSTLALTQAVPSIQFTRSGPAILFAVRGVGNTSAGSGEEGPNAFYVDNIYIADLTSLIIEFNNIERVEVLKGPQGTLFGRNASGGLVNIITREPGDKFVFDGKAGYANYQTVTGQAYVAGPISPTVSADIALLGRKQSKGWGTNLFTGRETALGWNWGARSKMVWRPSDNAKLTIAGEYVKFDDNLSSGTTLVPGAIGTGGFTSAGPFNTNTPDPIYAKRTAWSVSATGQFEFEGATLTNITAVRKVKTRSEVEGDYIPPQILRLGVFTHSDTFQQELRLASEATVPLSWQVGVFYLKINTFLNDNTFRGTSVGGVNSGYNLDSRMVANSYAAFGEATYAVTPTTFVTGGIRYTSEKRRLEASQIPINQTSAALINALTLVGRTDRLKFHKATFRAAIRQEIGDDLSIYGSYNTGFKAGLWGLQSPRNPPVRPQNTQTFEIGVKSQLFDDMVRLNVAAFHTKIKDYQVRSAASASVSLLQNAGGARVNGVEAELEVAPTKGLNLTAAATYLDSKFTDFRGALFTYPNPSVCFANATPPGATTGPATGGNRTCIGDATGNRLPVTSKFSANVGASYTVPVGSGDSSLTFNARYAYTGAFFFEPDNRNRQKGYGLLSGSIKYNITPNWGVEVWGNNLGDVRYKQSTIGTANADQGIFGPPRTYGVSVSADF